MARHDSSRGDHDFPSCPSRPPTIGLYVTLASGRFTYQNFCSLRAARYFLDCCLNGHDYTWQDNNSIVTTHGTHISTRGHHLTDHSLDHIISYTPTGYQPPEPLLTQWRCFGQDLPYTIEPSAGPAPATTSRRAHRGPKSQIDLDIGKIDEDTPASGSPSRRQRRAPADTAKNDFVNIQTIASSLKIDASRARSALRKAQVPKPPHGWAFDPSDVARITAIIKDNLR